jgi:hypothetical protein
MDPEKTPFSSLDLLRRFKALESRFLLMDGYDGSCAFILAIDPFMEFLEVEGVGRVKAECLKELQGILPDKLGAEGRRRIQAEARRREAAVERASHWITDEERAIPFDQLAKRERYDVILRHVVSLPGCDGTCGFVLDIDPHTFGSLKGVGKRKVRELEEIQGAIPRALKEAREEAEALKDLCNIDDVLSMELHDFLFGLPGAHRMLMQTRWRCAAEGRTLKSIAVNLGLTESRMSQISTKLEAQFANRLGGRSELFWKAIRPELDSKLEQLLPQLAGLFFDREAFFEAIERATGQPKGCISEAQHLPRSRDFIEILDDLISSHPAPIELEAALDFVQSESGLRDLLGVRLLERWEEMGHLEQVRDGLQPTGSRIRPAIAGELLRHPNGLPWLDLCRILNARHTQLELNEAEQPSVLRVSDHIYLSGRGIYRHREYLAANEESIARFIKALRAYLDALPEGRGRLGPALDELPKEVQFPYFDARDIVARRGEGAGIHFEGRSGSDSMSLTPEDDRVSMRDAVIQLFRVAKGALTIDEIRARLGRGTRSGHSVLLTSLCEQGLMIRLSRTHYESVDRLETRVDLQPIKEKIREIVEADARPIDADSLRAQVNATLGLAYTQFFYASLARQLADSLNWEIAYSIVGRRPLPFRSLPQLARVADAEASDLSSALSRMQSYLRVSRSRAIVGLNLHRQKIRESKRVMREETDLRRS